MIYVFIVCAHTLCITCIICVPELADRMHATKYNFCSFLAVRHRRNIILSKAVVQSCHWIHSFVLDCVYSGKPKLFDTWCFYCVQMRKSELLSRFRLSRRMKLAYCNHETCPTKWINLGFWNIVNSKMMWTLSISLHANFESAISNSIHGNIFPIIFQRLFCIIWFLLSDLPKIVCLAHVIAWVISAKIIRLFKIKMLNTPRWQWFGAAKKEM